MRPVDLLAGWLAGWRREEKRENNHSICFFFSCQTRTAPDKSTKGAQLLPHQCAKWRPNQRPTNRLLVPPNKSTTSSSPVRSPVCSQAYSRACQFASLPTANSRLSPETNWLFCFTLRLLSFFLIIVYNWPNQSGRGQEGESVYLGS